MYLTKQMKAAQWAFDALIPPYENWNDKRDKKREAKIIINYGKQKRELFHKTFTKLSVRTKSPHLRRWWSTWWLDNLMSTVLFKPNLRTDAIIHSLRDIRCYIMRRKFFQDGKRWLTPKCASSNFYHLFSAKAVELTLLEINWEEKMSIL